MMMTQEKIDNIMKDCTLCPRQCHADRLGGKKGYCGQGAAITAARAALHFWEEPCISGSQGSGAVFFSGCNLQCVFCQNRIIAAGQAGMEISVGHLAEIFLRLQEQGAVNINLVTGCHFAPQICLALEQAKKQGLYIPVVYNSGGYEEISTLAMLDGLIDIYLPDLKYHSPVLASEYSHAADYFEKAAPAIAEMYRQTGNPLIDPDTGLMKKGVIVRHLLLPGETGDSKKILRYLHDTYGNGIYISIMNQYTPLEHVAHISKLNRRVTDREYARVLKFADIIGIEQGYMQEGGTASESFIPEFDCSGII